MPRVKKPRPKPQTLTPEQIAELKAARDAERTLWVRVVCEECGQPFDGDSLGDPRAKHYHLECAVPQWVKNKRTS